MTSKISTQRLVLRYSISLLLAAILLGAIQKLIYTYLLPDVSLFNPIWKNYVWLVIMSLVTYGLVVLVHYVIKEYTGFAFIASIVFKMFVSLWFLYPLIESDELNKTPDIVNFFLPFFIFLIFEVWYSIRLLHAEEQV